MTEQVKRGVPWRIIGWSGTVVLLGLPFVAMRTGSDGVNWSAGDFIFAAVMFGTVGGFLELAVRKISNGWYRAGVAVALLANLAVIWVNLAVGIVGSEHNPANQLFFLALLVGIAGACAVRFRAAGMAWAMVASAVSLVIAFALASLGPADEPFVNHTFELVGTAVFVLLFLASAALFRRAAVQSSSSS